MKKLNFAIMASALVILVGCGKTNNYTPPADATGETIFTTACTGCHAPVSSNVAMVLSPNMANKMSIINKVQSGSMRMPSFPNIDDEAADRLAEYLLANSQTK